MRAKPLLSPAGRAGVHDVGADHGALATAFLESTTAREAGVNPGSYIVGATKVFFKAGALQRLEAAARAAGGRLVTAVQSVWRRVLARRAAARRRAAAVTAQALVRGGIGRARVRRLRAHLANARLLNEQRLRYVRCEGCGGWARARALMALTLPARRLTSDLDALVEELESTPTLAGDEVLLRLMRRAQRLLTQAAAVCVLASGQRAARDSPSLNPRAPRPPASTTGTAPPPRRPRIWRSAR